MSTILYLIAGGIFGWFVVNPVLAGYRQAGRIRDQLAMAQHVIAELAPKAKAWDDLQRHAARSPLPPLDLPIAGGQVEADLEKNYRVAYQHLSAECDSCEEPVELPPRRRRSDKMWDYR